LLAAVLQRRSRFIQFKEKHIVTLRDLTAGGQAAA
jgi:hypothetical protein